MLSKLERVLVERANKELGLSIGYTLAIVALSIVYKIDELSLTMQTSISLLIGGLLILKLQSRW